MKPCCRLRVLLGAAVLLAALYSSASAQLSGRIVRAVQDPFGPNSRVGFGLASDGTRLFASTFQDGDIRIVDPATLQITGLIHTPAINGLGLMGLAIHDGLLYAGWFQPNGDPNAFSQIFVIRPETGDIVRTIQTADNGVTGLSFGPDGFLYAAYGAVTPLPVPIIGSRFHVFDPMDGRLVRTLHGQYTVIAPDPLVISDLEFNDTIEFLPDGSILIDEDNGQRRLSTYSIVNDVLVRQAAFEVPGMLLLDWKGSALISDSLFVWGQSGSLGRWLYEVHIVPEPNSFLVLVASTVTLIAIVVGNKTLRRNQQRAADH